MKNLWVEIKAWWKRPKHPDVYIEESLAENKEVVYRVFYFDFWFSLGYRLSTINNTLEAAEWDFNFRLRKAKEYRRIKKLKTKKRIIKAG